MSIKNKISVWSDNLSLLEGVDRLQYLVDLANKKTSLSSDKRVDENKIVGCISKIWVDVKLESSKVVAEYDSDAMITKGITSVICDCFTGATKEEASSIVIDDFKNLNIKQLLTVQRQNGLGNLINTIINKSQKL